MPKSSWINGVYNSGCTIHPKRWVKDCPSCDEAMDQSADALFGEVERGIVNLGNSLPSKDDSDAGSK
jgi:hypothetical protein